MAQGPRQVMPLGGCGQPALSPAPHAPDRLLHLQQYLPESRWFPRGSAPPWASVRTTLALRSRRPSSVSLCPNQSSGSRRCVRGAPCGQTERVARSAPIAASGVCVAAGRTARWPWPAHTLTRRLHGGPKPNACTLGPASCRRMPRVGLVW